MIIYRSSESESNYFTEVLKLMYVMKISKQTIVNRSSKLVELIKGFKTRVKYKKIRKFNYWLTFFGVHKNLDEHISQRWFNGRNWNSK